MSTQPHLTTIADIVNRAVDVVDPMGAEPAVAEFAARFEDRDEPVAGMRNLAQVFEEAREAIDPAPTEAAVTVAAAVAKYLAYRRDELNEDPDTLLRLAARAELRDDADPSVRAWLAQRGVTL
jgi:hypothetical protein